MNKIYKVIYSKVRNCYVVVSELAKNNSKGTSRGTVVDSRKGTSLLAAMLAAGVMSFGVYGTALAAGPVAIENGAASKADGIASIAVGVGDKVVSSNNTYQGATSLAVGTLNIVDADAKVPFDGVASSVIGQVNYTKNANAAVIMGADNRVTNSYRDVKLDEKTLQALMQAYQQNNMQKVTEILQEAVPKSGGQVMAFGGGNTVDYAQASQVMGVSNTLKGTKDSISKYNLVDGFQNNVTGAQNTYVVGTKNEVLNTQNTIALGDNRRLDKVKGAIVIGSADAALTTNVDNGVVIGNNAQVLHSGGTTGKTVGNGDIAIGANAHTNNYIDQGGGIAIGSNSFVENMTGGLERSFDFNQAGYDSMPFIGKYGLPHDPSKMITGVAIGQNTYARSGSIMLGTHNYKGALGDVTVDSANSKQQNGSILSTTIGTNSYSNGMFSTALGSYSIASSKYSSAAEDVGKNFGATIVGSLNSIESASASSKYSGVANSIVGTANRTFNSNGSLIFGAGNEITNSVMTISTPSDGGDSAKALQQTLMQKVQTSNGGGATLAIGGGNKADYAQQSQLLGVGNTLTGTSSSISKFNMLDGYKNTATNVSNTKIIGSNNTVNDKADSNTIIGDKHVVAAEKTNNVIIGNADKELTTSVSDAVLIGHNANATVDGGVALGSGSVATVDKGVPGYDPSTKAASTSTDAVWKATDAAVSVGKADGSMTRQITGVAAGTNDTDAVNVAQLKQVNTAVAANKVHYYSVKSKYQDGTSNYNNDGARAEESMVIGIGSSSDASFSTVIGTNNTANRFGSTEASGMNDTVVGQYVKTAGSFNNILGTYDQVGKNFTFTEVYGNKNTVLGVGNQVGSKDNKSNENTVIGMTNKVEGFGSIVVGNSTKVLGQDAANATSIGHVNTIYNQQEGGGQWGVALGNHLTVKGEYALAVGNNSTAQGAKTVAVGYNASATVAGGAAIGSGSVASVDAGVEGYKPNASADTSKDPAGTWKSTDAAISVGKADGSMTRQITGVAAGTNATDAVNVAQLKQAVAGAKDGNDTLVSNDNALSLNGKQLSMNIKDTAGNTVSGSVDLSKIAAAVDTNTTYTLDGKDNGDNTTTISLKDNDGNASGTVTVATKDTRNTVEAGENVTLDTKDNADGSHVYKVNVKADGKVAAGDTKLVSGGTVYNETRVQQDGTYVKQSNTAGQNLSALDNQVANNSSSINRLNGRVNDLDSRINKVGASAAALAALHPQDFNPDDKWDFAVGYGNYRDANAMAIGAFYRPDENVMFSMGTNFGNGENMINAGVTFKLGPKNHTTSNKYLLSKEVTTLRATVAQQDAQLKQQSNEIKELREMVSKLMEKAK